MCGSFREDLGEYFINKSFDRQKQFFIDRIDFFIRRHVIIMQIEFRLQAKELMVINLTVQQAT